MLTVESMGLKPNKAAQAGYVYLLQPTGVAVYKIGHTVNSRKRMNGYKRQFKFPVHYVARIRTNDCEQLEQYFHREHRAYRLIGEWFVLPPSIVKSFIRLEEVSKESL